jgi:hypothetical protein
MIQSRPRTGVGHWDAIAAGHFAFQAEPRNYVASGSALRSDRLAPADDGGDVLGQPKRYEVQVVGHVWDEMPQAVEPMRHYRRSQTVACAE